MKSQDIRFMWLMIFFDLPVGTKDQRKRANQFRHYLKDDGFMMLQFSVYARICRGQDAVDKHLRRVRDKLPREGAVRALQVTDKQYGRMELLLGTASKNETIGSAQLVLL